MSLYLNTLSNQRVSVAICDRCKFKVPIGALVSDPNSPGLRVCRAGCVDLYDPYRLPARQTEDITVQYPRLDSPLSTTDYIFTEDGETLDDEAQDPLET